MALHGTPASTVDPILADGFSLDAPKRSEPGDFGDAVYLTACLCRAQYHGDVLRVRVNLTNPLIFPTAKEAYAWRDEVIQLTGDTARGPADERRAAARALREWMLERGHDGIVIQQSFMPGPAPHEVVVYDPAALAVEGRTA